MTQNVIDIIINAQDQYSEALNNLNSKVGELGNKTREAQQKAQQATEKYNQKLKETIKNIDDVAKNGPSSFNKLSKSQQDAVVKFNTLNNKSQELIRLLSEMGIHGKNSFLQLTAEQQNILKNWQAMETEMGVVQRTLEQVKTRIQLAGGETDGLRGKFNILKGVIGVVGDELKNKWERAFDSVNTKLDGVKNKLSGLNTTTGQVASGFASAFGMVGLGSITQATVGLAMTREQMTSLTQATMGSRGEAEKFVNTMDKMTDSSLVSLNDLGQAMSTIKMSTGMSNAQLEKFSTTVNDIGQRAILMGKSNEEAISLMQAAGRGLNGEFEILKSNFGITKQQLLDLGWSGAADDVEGYQKALDKALEAGGSMDEMMNTTTGQIALIKKGFSTAGRQIGEVFLPAIKQVLSFMVQLKETHPEVFKVVIVVGALVSAFATILPVLIPIIEAFQKFNKFMLDLPGKISNLIGKLTSLPAKFKDLKDKISSAKDKLTELYNKLKENVSNRIDILKNKFKELKATIQDVKTKVSDLWKKIKENVAGKIDVIKEKFIALADSINLAAIKEKLLAAYQWLVNAATAVWNALLDANPVMIIVIAIVALIGVLLYLYNTNEDVRNAIDGFFKMLQDFGGWLISTLGPIFQSIGAWLGNLWNMLTTGEGVIDGVNSVFQFFHDILTGIGEFLPDEFIPVWELLIGIFDTVWNAVSKIVEVFMQFMDGQISLQEAIGRIWNIILNTFISIGTQILNFIIQWASNLWNQAVTAGSNFLNGVSQYIRQLPSKVWNWIIETARKIIVGAVSWVTGGNQGAINTVNAVINHVKDLPGKVYTEFINIGNKIKEAFNYVVQKAKDFGNGIKNAVLGALQIFSPGIIQKKIAREFADIPGRIAESIKPAQEVATEFGEAIRDNVGDMNLSPDLSMSTPGVDIDNPAVSMGADTSNLQNGLADVSTIASDGNNAIMSSFDLLNENMNSSLTQMVTDNLNAYTNMQVNDSNTMNQIRANMSNSLNTMRTTTNTQLNSMLNTTKQTNTKVTSSWSQMGGSVIKTSENIKTKATGYFNQLSSTIGGFYRKLQNPSSWGSGSYGGSTGKPSTIRHVGHSDNMSNKIKSIFQRQKIDTEKISIRQAELNPFIDTTSLNYINPSHSLNSTVSLTDLAKYGALKLPTGNFGGWDATKQNYKHIHDTANKWKMKTPNIGRYTTNGKFIVEQFETGVPQIDYNTFRSLAEDVYSQTQYDFYANSEKYGNWQTAFMSGAFNCSDGADSLVAMAHAFGLSARKVHGHWNNLGHFWAEVEGHKMDTTGWQQHRTWTPSQSHAGPAPRNSFWEDPLASLKELVSNDSEEKSTTVDETPLTLNASINLNHSVNLENVPENINEEELTSIISGMLEDTANDERWIDRLVNNQVFQDLDLRIKERIQNRENRNRGVIH